jgi:hypothetical protein
MIYSFAYVLCAIAEVGEGGSADDDEVAKAVYGRTLITTNYEYL